MKLRGLFPTTSALAVLLLGLLCLLPATHAVDCTNIQKDTDTIEDIFKDCANELELAGGEGVNLKLGTLDQVQLDNLLKNKNRLTVGIDIQDSAVESINSIMVVEIVLEKDCFIRIWDNLKLKEIKLSSLQAVRTTAAGAIMQILNNPKLTSIDIPAGKVSVRIVAMNNERLDQAGVDKLRAASGSGDHQVSEFGVCDFGNLKDAAFLEGCHTNKAPKTIKLLPGAKQSATWDDVKLHIEGCLEVTNTKLTTLDFLKDAPGGCPDPVITGNKELCSFGPLTTVDTLTNCDAKCFKWTELSGKTCAVGEKDMMIDFNGDASLTQAHIERLVEVHGALSISNFPDDQLTINLQKMTIPAGASQMGLTIKGDMLNKLEFTHPIVFNPTPATGVVLLTVETNSWTYTEQEIQKIIADSGIQREQMLFNGQVPIFATTSAPTTAPPPGAPGPTPGAPSPAGGPSGSGDLAGAAAAAPRRPYTKKPFLSTRTYILWGCIGVYLLCFMLPLGIWMFWFSKKRRVYRVLAANLRDAGLDIRATLAAGNAVFQQKIAASMKAAGIKRRGEEFAKEIAKLRNSVPLEAADEERISYSKLQRAKPQRKRNFEQMMEAARMKGARGAAGVDPPVKRNRYGKRKWRSSMARKTWAPKRCAKYVSDFFPHRRKQHPISVAPPSVSRPDKYEARMKHLFAGDDRYTLLKKPIPRTDGQMLQLPNLIGYKDPAVLHPGKIGRLLWGCRRIRSDEYKDKQARKRLTPAVHTWISVLTPDETRMRERYWLETKQHKRFQKLKTTYMTGNDITAYYISPAKWFRDLAAMGYKMERVYTLQYYTAAESAKFPRTEPTFRTEKRDYWTVVEATRVAYAKACISMFYGCRWVHLDKMPLVYPWFDAEEHCIRPLLEAKCLADEVMWLRGLVKLAEHFIKTKLPYSHETGRDFDEGDFQLRQMGPVELQTMKQEIYQEIARSQSTSQTGLHSHTRQKQFQTTRALFFKWWHKYAPKFAHFASNRRHRRRYPFVQKKMERTEALALWMQMKVHDWLPLFLCPVEYQQAVAAELQKLPDDMECQLGDKTCHPKELLETYSLVVDELQDIGFVLLRQLQQFLIGHIYSFHVPAQLQFIMLMAKKVRCEYAPFLWHTHDHNYYKDLLVYWDMRERKQTADEQDDKE